MQPEPILFLAAPKPTITRVIASGPPIILSSWSPSTTLRDWLTLPDDIKKRTAFAARTLSYKDRPGKGNHGHTGHRRSAMPVQEVARL